MFKYVNLTLALALIFSSCNEASNHFTPSENTEKLQIVPDTSSIPNGEEKKEILYGRELFVNTQIYIGPKGKNGIYTSNEMNCQHCHSDAGSKPYCNPLVSSHGRYPQYRKREGKILTLAERINNCIMRPLLGKPLPDSSREMKALLVYFRWINEGIPSGKTIQGDIPLKINYINRAADTAEGRSIFMIHCKRCHGDKGEGKKNTNGYGYTYPPLWGSNSYEMGSSMHRNLKLAAFIKYNMPYGKEWYADSLSDEQAFDVAAFINDERINPRPELYDRKSLFPNITDKPIDFPFGPFSDPFSENQHRYGPYQPIEDYYINLKK